MKYIVLAGESYGIKREFPLVFPNTFVHADMARMFQRQILKGWGMRAEPIAAGFLNSMTIGAQCYGESESLNLKSREQQDTDLIMVADYTHGIVP